MTCIVVSPLEELTPRQLDILHWIAEGESDGEIGKRLHLSMNTVKYHAANIRLELGLRNRVQMAVMYHIWAAVPV